MKPRKDCAAHKVVEMLDRFMIVTIEKNRIPLSDPFFTVASGFHPKYAPKR